MTSKPSGQITDQEQATRLDKIRLERANAGSPDQANRPSTAAANSPQQSAPGGAKTAIRAIWLLALVVLLACMFSTLDNVVTLANAQGSISVETWPRLFLAASGLAAGALFDIRERRYMGFIMFAVTVLSTISILAVEAGASPVIGLIVFYLSSGFFVTFFTTTFCSLRRTCARRSCGRAWAAPPTTCARSPCRGPP